MTMIAEYTYVQATKGVSLVKLGLKDVALTREDALIAIQILKRAKTPILGGDVYIVRHGNIEPAYANWYVDQMEAEATGDFAERSGLAAKDFVGKYPQNAGEEPLFVLVLGNYS